MSHHHANMSWHYANMSQHRVGRADLPDLPYLNLSQYSDIHPGGVGVLRAWTGRVLDFATLQSLAPKPHSSPLFHAQLEKLLQTQLVRTQGRGDGQEQGDNSKNDDQQKVKELRREAKTKEGLGQRRRKVPRVDWPSGRPFVAEVVERGRPVLLRGMAHKLWPHTRTWNWTHLETLYNGPGDDRTTANPERWLQDVKVSTYPRTRFFDPDLSRKGKLGMGDWPTLPVHLPYAVRPVKTDEFFGALQAQAQETQGQRRDSGGEDFLEEVGEEGPARVRYYYFDSLSKTPKDFQASLMPKRELYLEDQDWEERKQFVWLSSAGVYMHTHIDQDHNFFVQLLGAKRFTLFPSSQHLRLHMFPRIHPLWHKSRADHQWPDINNTAPDYQDAEAWEVLVEAGDVLYIPPMCWHHVTHLEPSVSLSTMSHLYSVYDGMNSVYKHDHKFDLLPNKLAKRFALRLFLDLLLTELIGPDATRPFIAQVLRSRYFGSGAELFPTSPQDARICTWTKYKTDPATMSEVALGAIPTCQHVYGDVSFDVHHVVAPSFREIWPLPVRDVLLADYIEQMAAEVVGPQRVFAFLRFCFQGQRYFVTSGSQASPEDHELWSRPEQDTTDT
eukprot:gb/GEZN01003237.1/.p1 GENE.gb/GEZN01003237.1/~~gb/GEZN01003237.1/.p1  ORF type:complete len:719 (-),score=176.32 gb/GEZN01003237.1/:74-1912(-)